MYLFSVISVCLYVCLCVTCMQFPKIPELGVRSSGLELEPVVKYLMWVLDTNPEILFILYDIYIYNLTWIFCFIHSLRLLFYNRVLTFPGWPWTYHIAKGLAVLILLLPPLKCCDYRCVPPCAAFDLKLTNLHDPNVCFPMFLTPITIAGCLHLESSFLYFFSFLSSTTHKCRILSWCQYPQLFLVVVFQPCFPRPLIEWPHLFKGFLGNPVRDSEGLLMSILWIYFGPNRFLVNISIAKENVFLLFRLLIHSTRSNLSTWIINAIWPTSKLRITWGFGVSPVFFLAVSFVLFCSLSSPPLSFSPFFGICMYILLCCVHMHTYTCNKMYVCGGQNWMIMVSAYIILHFIFNSLFLIVFIYVYVPVSVSMPVHRLVYMYISVWISTDKYPDSRKDYHNPRG